MLIVLDLDDTLYLERDYVRSGFVSVDQWIQDRFQLKGFFEKAWQLFIDGSRGKIFNQTLSDLGLTENGVVETLVSVYRSHKPNLELEQDAAVFLSAQPKIFLAIITDGFSISQWAKVGVLGLKESVGQIVVTGDWGKDFWKPHPRAFETVSMGRNPKECVYIGDNPKKDFKAPEQLGWATSIRLRRPGSLHFDLETPASCIEVSSFDEIMRMF